MIKTLNSQILHIARQLDSDLYMSTKKRQKLEQELKTLLDKRDIWYESTGIYKATLHKTSKDKSS